MPARPIAVCVHAALLVAQFHTAGCGSGPRQDSRDGIASPLLFAEDDSPQISALSYSSDELLIRTLPGSTPEGLSAALARAGVAVVEALPEIETVVARVTPARLIEAADSLAAEPILEAVQKNYYFPAQRAPDDPRFADQQPLTVVGLPDAWEITTGADSLLVAVLDTGVFAAHPDLAGRTLSGRNSFERTVGSDDDFGHGTLVAGVLGASSDNATGVAGVNWTSPILAVRVTNAAGRASSAAIASGIVWAVNRGARVINVSFAPLQDDGVVLRAARHAYAQGALVFISAGNDGAASTSRGAREAVFVGATDDEDNLASFSSTGPFVDLVAPGVAVWSTTHEGDYRAVSGTSFACPIASGVAALVWSARPQLRPVTVERLLRETAVDLGAAGQDALFGAGRIDAAAALAAARLIVENDDRRAPMVTLLSPADGAEVSGTVRVSADAADLDNGLGVAEVTLYVDGVAQVGDEAAPYRFALSTLNLPPGEHTVGVIATDAAGNSSAPSEIRIRVAGETTPAEDPDASGDVVAPQVTLQFPIAGANVSGQVGIHAIATDNLALQTVELLIDGAVRQVQDAAGTRASVSFVWDSAGAATGDHEIAVRAIDAKGNPGRASVKVRKR